MEVSAAQSPSAAGYNRMARASLAIGYAIGIYGLYFAVMTAFTAVDQML